MQAFRTIQRAHSQLRLLRLKVLEEMQAMEPKPPNPYLIIPPRFSYYDFKRDSNGKTKPLDRFNIIIWAMIFCLGPTKMLHLDRTTGGNPNRQLLSQVELLEPVKWFHFCQSELRQEYKKRLERATEIIQQRRDTMQTGASSGTLVHKIEEVIAMREHLDQIYVQAIAPLGLYRNYNNTIKMLAIESLHGSISSRDIMVHHEAFCTGQEDHKEFSDLVHQEYLLQSAYTQAVHEILTSWHRHRTAQPDLEEHFHLDVECTSAIIDISRRANSSLHRIVKHLLGKKSKFNGRVIARERAKRADRSEKEYTYVE